MALLMGRGSLDRVELRRTRLADLSVTCNFEKKDARVCWRAGAGTPVPTRTGMCVSDVLFMLIVNMIIR